MASYNKKNNISLLLRSTFFILLCQLIFICPSFSHHNENHTNGSPAIYSISPQFIHQGQTNNVIVTGENLPNIVGVSGGDVYAVILRKDSTGNTLVIQLSASPSALGLRNLILRNASGIETSFPFQVILSESPKIESLIPYTAYAGDTILARISGENLTNPFIASLSEQVLVISSRPSSDGSLVDITLSINENIAPGSYPILVSTPYGQAETSITILNSENKINNLDSFNADPYSPGIYSIEYDPSTKTVTLKGAMFDSDPYKNIVTLLENNDGTVIGRQIEVTSGNNNEIVVNLPDDITSDSISFAVSSSEGKSSNIKAIDLDPTTTISNDQTNSEPPPASTEAKPEGVHLDVSTIASNTAPTNTYQPTNQPKPDTVQNETPKIAEVPSNKPATELTNTTLTEETNIAQNIQNLSQYLFTNNLQEAKNESKEVSIKEINDPEKLISSIEESKQIKNQADLIMIALAEAKGNEELSNTLKKAETLKTKVEELEKLLTNEKQKNNPNQRKLARYQQLLASANAESKSQTFALLNNLLKYKPQLKNLLTQKPFDLAAIQPNIPPNSVILQYVPTEEGLIIFVVDNKNLKTRINKSVTKERLNKEVQAYRQLFEKEIEKIKSTGRVTPIISWKDDKSNTYKKDILPLKEKNIFLYNALIAPVEKEIESKKLIAVIANGWLRYLPFQSLAKPTKDGDLSFLINDKSIVYLDSVIALGTNTAPPLTTMSSITVIANPDGTLSGANKEAEIISSLFSKSTTAFVQRPFNISLINQLAHKADVVHLATHGYLDGTDIDASYLVSGKKKVGKNIIQDKIFLKDIYDLNLSRSKLVVLSGCDTGKLGSLLNEPDDIVGSLATAFRVAGADTILASLWKAHDEATKIIMQNFYQNLKSGLDKAESLRRAELKVKENPKYSHPLFWSLFNLIGDWR